MDFNLPDLNSAALALIVAHMLIGVFVTWRVTHMLVYETGPFEVFLRLRLLIGVHHYRYEVTSPDEVLIAPAEVIRMAKRNRLAFAHRDGSNPLARAFVCHKCLSVWVAFAVAFIMGSTGIGLESTALEVVVLQGLVYSAVAILIEQHVD